ncbi:MAG: Trimeric GatFAB AmidoTransferase(AdT) complex subunit [Candelina submexicana]|nr:MAG: Trimeric GatFAB AmidoTransferase(AdT) complex subunit [Candelina submexicana]
MSLLLRQAQQCLSKQASYKALNAFIDIHHPESVIEKVKHSIATDDKKATLVGKLIAIKDNICTLDHPTTCASKILLDFISPYDASIVSKLKNEGAVIAGKTNLDGFGMGSHSTHSPFGPVKNHKANHEHTFSAGGSSGGSAVAVTTGQCYAALGTDTGGSVRLPAAYTRIIGFKPSYGLISRWGVVAYANSLDTVGVLASDCKTVKEVFNAVKGHDVRDPTSLPDTSRARIRRAVVEAKRDRPLRIGVPLEYNIQELSPVVRKAWTRLLQRLHNAGHTITSVTLPTTKQALSAYYILAPAEASSNLAKYDGVRYGNRAGENDGARGVLFAKTRGEGFGDEVKRRILLGAYSLSAEAIGNYFIQAQKIRRMIRSDFNNVFSLPNALLPPVKREVSGTVDVLICPTAPTLPPTLDSVKDQTPTDAYMNDVFTVPASLAGLPAISVPVPIAEADVEDRASPFDNVGMQVIGQYGDDDLVLDVASAIEKIDWDIS